MIPSKAVPTISIGMRPHRNAKIFIMVPFNPLLTLMVHISPISSWSKVLITNPDMSRPINARKIAYPLLIPRLEVEKNVIKINPPNKKRFFSYVYSLGS